MDHAEPKKGGKYGKGESCRVLAKAFFFSFVVFFCVTFLHAGIVLRGNVVSRTPKLDASVLLVEQFGQSIQAFTNFWWWSAVLFATFFVWLIWWAFRE